MMGPKQEPQAALFYEFALEGHVPQDHLLRSIDRFVDLASVRTHLADFYSHTGRPSVDPELLIRMLLVGYCFGIRSERRLCEEVHLNLAYRWFCRLDLTNRVPSFAQLLASAHFSKIFKFLIKLSEQSCFINHVVGQISKQKTVWLFDKSLMVVYSRDRIDLNVVAQITL